MIERIYQNIRRKMLTAEDGTTQFNFYGSISNYPFLVLPNMEAARRIKDFLVKVIEQKETKKK
jgi:hypothetical protein